MKTDKTKLLKDIEAMKEKLALMEEELNKPEEFKHFPSEGDKYYYYAPIGIICSNNSSSDDLKVNVYKTEEEAEEAYKKAIALEKVKRRLLELHGDWKPDWTDRDEKKFCIHYDHLDSWFKCDYWYTIQHGSIIPYMRSEEITLTIINEMEEELKLVFNIT